jgi:hypothetical protein
VKLERIDIGPSPERRGHMRLTGWVSYARARDGVAQEAVWYDVPDAFADALTTSGNPWLAGLLPLAMVFGEPLVLSRPVDATLLDHAHELMAIWNGWHPQLPVVPIEADVLDLDGPETGADAGVARNPRTASFFSGGVDSFSVALRDRAAPIDDLLLVLGTFDLADATPEALERVRTTMQRAADALGKTLVAVTTNQIRTRMRDSRPQSLSGTSMLAAVALALERRWRRVILAAGGDLDTIVPTAFNPLLTPLSSTSRLRFDDEGVAMSRIAKTVAVAQSDVALASLRVCFRSGDESNCMRCVKCMRTAVMLEALGVLGKATPFRTASLAPSRVARTAVTEMIDRHFFGALPAFCREHGRPDLARAVEQALARARRHDPFRPLVRWLRRLPVVGNATHRLEALVQDADPATRARR